MVDVGSLEVREEETPETAPRFDDDVVPDRDAVALGVLHAVSITATKIDKAA